MDQHRQHDAAAANGAGGRLVADFGPLGRVELELI
jgi:hypothetical protein